MFRGHSYRSLDPKGRLMLPPEFRDQVSGNEEEGRLMLTNSDGCVVGYPMPEWETIEQGFSQVNLLERKARDFHRFFISGAMEVILDKQGRILIPPYLREYAGLRKDVVLAGVGSKFEIWDRERFESQRREMEQQYDQVMDALAAKGFQLRI